MFNIERECQLAAERRAVFLQEARQAELIKQARGSKPGRSAQLLWKCGAALIVAGEKLRGQVELTRPADSLENKVTSCR
jgi:hypothetical protein